MIRVESLGQCSITIGTTRLVPTAPVLFGAALYLATEGTRPIARAAIASLMWPELDEARATHSLRQLLYRLRGEGAPIISEGESVHVEPDAVSIDYASLLASDARIEAEHLLGRIPGGFLPGYLPTISRPFAEWVESERARVNGALRRLLVGAVAGARAGGDWPATQALAQRCLELDPLNEEATLALAEAMAMEGSKARAIMILDRYLEEIDAEVREQHRPAIALRKRIAALYPLPPIVERDPPQIGRDAEMAVLDAALKRARAGRGEAILISGAAGIGKTRLVTEFTRAAELRGIAVVRAHMGRYDRERPLGAWSDVVPILQRMPGALGIDPVHGGLLRRLFLPAPEAEGADSLSAEYLSARLRLAILDLLSAVASESCTIILIEDVHFMDDLSWDVVAALTRRVAEIGMLVLLTRRDGEDLASVPPSDARLLKLPLEPLDEAACGRLFRAVDPVARADDDDGFTAWCVRTSAGNPYHLIELVRHASRTGGRFEASPNLKRLISQRFSDVTPLARRVLQASAMLGRHATLSRIERVLGERRIALLEALDELARRSLIRLDGDHATCWHDLLGISALDASTAASIRLMQQHAAMVLETEWTDETSPAQLWDCARLWSAGGDAPRARRLLDACARRALQIGAVTTAVAVLEEMLRGEPPEEAERADIEAKLIRALYLSRAFSRLVAVAEGARVRGARAGADQRVHSQEELYELEASVWVAGRKAEAVAAALACAEDPSAEPEHRVRAAALVGKHAGDMFDRESTLRATEAVAPLLGQVAPIVAAEFRMFSEFELGTTAACAAAARERMRLAEAAGELADVTRIAGHCVHAFFMNGEIGEVYRTGYRSIERALQLGMSGQARANIDFMEATVLSLGDVRVASELHEMKVAREDPAARQESTIQLGHRVRLLLLEGRAKECEPIAAQYLAAPPRPWPRAMAHVAAVEILLRVEAKGQVPSDEEVQALIARHRAGRRFGLHDFFVYALCMAMDRRGEWDRAVALYDEYVAAHRRERGPILRQLAELMRH